jgi:hypothetical protein
VVAGSAPLDCPSVTVSTSTPVSGERWTSIATDRRFRSCTVTHPASGSSTPEHPGLTGHPVVELAGDVLSPAPVLVEIR